MSTAETERVRRIWDKLAPKYDKIIRLPERWLFAGGREWVCSQATGNVLEIAVGTGRNLEHYPADAGLTAVDLSESMLAIAKRRAEALGRRADLRVGDAQELEFSSASFDTVVCTLSLCSIPDDAKAVAEVNRVLRPGGRFLLLEHVASPGRLVRAVQSILEPIMVRLEGDHLVREPLVHLRREGFEIERLERLKWGIVERVAARKPIVPRPA
jgi:ubiquinone/menaquinone biosynthesis C-methylase UbiE